jgi:hypothetical protein
MRESDGVLTNTWEDLDATTLKAMRKEKSYGLVPVYAVGPLIKPVVSPASRSQLLDWLDKQLVESVLYIAFGSLGALSAQQITELASGLELSLQRFMWVLRHPSNKDSHASADRDDDVLAYLPDGFLEQTHGMGLVVMQWAPQSDILWHSWEGFCLVAGGSKQRKSYYIH